MDNTAPRLFTRLYTSIIFAVLFSVVLTRFSVEHLFEQDGINDFVRDTHSVYLQLQQQLVTSPEKILTHPHPTFPYANEFNIQWRSNNSGAPFCSDCEYIGDASGIKVFELADARLLAVYEFPKHNLVLLISDVAHHPIQEVTLPVDGWTEYQEVDDIDVEQIVFYLFALISILVIGCAVYFPIRQLQKQIMSLVLINKQFGEGKLSTRSTQRYNKPLDELASSFNNMATAITDTVKENQIFAQAVPHEVRTPLSRIQLAVGLLQKMNDDQRQIALLENIDTYIDDINDLISQIVAFTRLSDINDEANNAHDQEIHLEAFVDSRLKALRHDASIHVSASVESGLTFFTNPMYLRLVIDNLIKNAVNYAQKEVHLSIQQQSGNIILCIEDDGEGIASEHYETVFIPFARLDESRSRKTGGLGIGLSITKAATKKMQADISVGRSHLGGARFTCFLFANQ